jgi:hypothetical protein
MTNEKIIGLWGDLVVATGATKPLSVDPKQIYLVWCPEDTLDAELIRERRPELKEILRQSLSGELSESDFKTEITRKIEFKRLINEVHQGIEQIGYEELFKWSLKNVPKVKKELLTAIAPETKRNLRASLSSYFSFKEKIDELNGKMGKWIKEYDFNLTGLKEVAAARSDLVDEKHNQQLDLSTKRLNDVVLIQNKLPDLIYTPIHGLKDKMIKEVIDAIMSGSILSQIPDWAGEIDAIKMGQNMTIMNKVMELEIETPPDKEIDRLLTKLEEIMNGPVEEILKKLSTINLNFKN